MEHDLETLEHQTAPESTRGLFDPPEQNVSFFYPSLLFNTIAPFCMVFLGKQQC
ncbi:hypothetical protein BDB00DRAFT_866046, partial [Zychaea mexicana]|uniref:uncharacterized protein n=1 Tax=Zychaea mexicana TaxID=64656 RepID=UPI0022FE2DF2